MVLDPGRGVSLARYLDTDSGRRPHWLSPVNSASVRHAQASVPNAGPPFAVPRQLRNLPAAAPPCLASYASCAPALSWCHRSIVGSHTVTAIYKLCYKLRGAESAPHAPLGQRQMPLSAPILPTHATTRTSSPPAHFSLFL